LSFASDVFVFAHEPLDGAEALDGGQSGAGEFLFEAAHPVLDRVVNPGDNFFRYQIDEIGA